MISLALARAQAGPLVNQRLRVLKTPFGFFFSVESFACSSFSDFIDGNFLVPSESKCFLAARFSIISAAF
jgi:hypothetical protein